MTKMIALLTLLVCLPAFAGPPSDAPVVDGNSIVPLEKGDEAPFPGLLYPEAEAAKTLSNKIDLKKLKTDYEADQKAWAAKEGAYKKQIDEYKPTWWSEHKGEIGLVSGFILGAATVVVVVFAVNQAQKP